MTAAMVGVPARHVVGPTAPIGVTVVATAVRPLDDPRATRGGGMPAGPPLPSAPMDPALALARIPSRPPRSDLALAAALLAWGLLEALLAEGPGSTPWRIAFAVLITVPLAFRRQAAAPVMLFVVAVTLANALNADQEEMGAISFPCLLVSNFSVALYARPVAVAFGGLALAGTWAGVMFTSDYYGGGQGPTDYAIISFFIAGSWVGGWIVRRRAAQTRRAIEESAELARTAVVDERAAIARELHDVVAHGVSIIAVQAGAAEELIGQDPERARAHVGLVRQTARETMTELRRLLDVLREEDAAYAPQPGLARLNELVAEARSSGLDVELVHSGDVRELPAGLDLTAYRIVQEALTNVRKHAGPVATRVVLHQTDEALEVEVVNAPGTKSPNGTPGGHGLIGMRERVRLFEGTIETGPHEGGFRVHVRLPRPEPVA